MRPDRALFWALTLANVALITLLPVLGGHDLPQHLGYARILADYDQPGLGLRETFALPDGAEAYFSTHYLLAALTRVSSVMTACRIVYAAYAIALPCSIASLVDAASEDDPAPAWTGALGALLVWNPVACMGFLPFMLALPVLVFAAAELLRAQHAGASRGRVLRLALLCALLASIHIVAAALFGALAAMLVLARASRRGLALLGVVAAATGAALAAWHWAGPGHLAPMPEGALRDAIARYGVWDGLAAAVGARWNTPSEKLELLKSTIFGPLPGYGKTIVAAALVATALCVRRTGAREVPARTTLRRALAGFAVLVAGMPASFAAPDAICLVDFRAMVVLLALAVAALDPRAFAAPRARRALAACAGIVTVLWARQLAGVGREGAAVVDLVRRLRPDDVLLALAFHDRSEFLDEANSVTHYLPVYHTVLNGGVTSLFWGKVSHHLPIAYRPGKEPPHPPDWRPWEYSRRDLDAASAVMVEWPDTDDDGPAVLGADALRDELGRGFRPVECRGRWCLYARDASAGPDA